TDTAVARLEALVATTDGFELAEKDLELRGEGQLLGTRQAGLSEFRFTRLRADRGLLERARELADELIADCGPVNAEVARLFAGVEVASLAWRLRSSSGLSIRTAASGHGNCNESVTFRAQTRPRGTIRS